MRTLIALVTAVLLMAQSAHADDREDARKAFAEGQAADKAEDWQSAIEHYQRANDLMPHHFALYNIARDYERLGQLREAAVWYTRYVEAAPPSGDRDKVQKLLGEIKLRPAKLTVKSTPPGARVTIDGQKVGVTPFTAPIRGGGHRVAVELDGQRDERDVALEYGEPETVELTLRGVVARPTPTVKPVGLQGLIVVRGQPEGALITVDNVPAGTVPMSIPVAEGQHQIKVTSFGYADYSTTAFVTRGNEATVEVAMGKANTGQVPDSGPPTIGYMLGVSGGADVRGDGGVLLAAFGVRFAQYDMAVRVGKAAGFTALDFVARWAFLKTRLSPFIGAGYSYVIPSGDEATGSSSSSSGGSGYEVVGGLRFDLSRGPGATFSIVGEVGVRSFSEVQIMNGSKSGVFFPITAALQVTFGRTR